MTTSALARSCLLLCVLPLACGLPDASDDGADTEGATDSATDGNDDGADETAGDDGGPQVDGMATIEGYVTNPNGDALAGVTIATAQGEATSEADGHFVLETPADDGATIVIELRAPGFVRSHERFVARDGAVNVVRAIMMPEAPALPLDATMGGTVAGSRNATIVAPPGAFVRQDGTAVDGMVEVHLTPLNPAVAEEYDAYPGDGLARSVDGGLVQLETFGVLDVTVRQGGEELNIADGMGVEVQIPLPDPAPDNPPETMPLWSFDEAEGVWAEEGTLTLDAAAGVYRGTLPHLSPWNADQPLSATCIRGRVEDPDGNPVAGAMVFAQGVDYLGGSTTVTDGDGEFCVAARKDSTVEVTAYGLDGSVSRVVDSGSTDTPIPVQCDVDCLDTGSWTLVPGEGDPTWGGGVCEPPDEETWLSLSLGGDIGFTLDLGASDDIVACGFQIDDPAPAPGEPAGTTYLTFTEVDGYSGWVVVNRGAEELGAFEGTVVAQPTDTAQDDEIIAATCALTVDEADEVDDDIYVVAGNGPCEGYRAAGGGYATGSGDVDFRGVAGLFNGIVPLICCDVDAMPGMVPVPGAP